MKLIKYFLTAVFSIAVFFTSLNTTSISANSKVMLKLEETEYAYNSISGITGENKSQSIFKMNLNNRYAFCVESGIWTNTGVEYTPQEFDSPTKDYLSKIAYYGYTKTNRTNYDYAVTQLMIWEHLGDKLISTNVPNYQKRKNEIINMIKNHNVVPSWDNETVVIDADTTLTLNDSNNVVNKFNVVNNTTNADINIKNNTITINASSNSKDGEIIFNKFSNNEIGASIVYKKPNTQSLVEFRLEENISAKLKIDVVHYGNITIKKIDEDTGEPLPNAKINFEYDDVKESVITDAEGIARLNHIKEGTKVKITEVQAPHGYYNPKVDKEVIIEGNKDLSITLTNKLQMGQFNLTKLGNSIDGYTSKETEYGTTYSFTQSYKPLAGVKYVILATEDIIVNDKILHKSGEVVTTATTGIDGKFTNPLHLHLGSYQAIEVSAPSGYIIDSTPIDFKFEYAGQNIEVIHKDAEVKNEHQKVRIKLKKNEEYIKEWNNNNPIIKEVPANDKIFGLFTNQDFIINDEIIPKDSLITFDTVNDGVLKFKKQYLLNGSYYVQEIDSGNYHILDETKYEFEYVPLSNNENEIIDINELLNGNDPLLNHLAKGTLEITKVDSENKIPLEGSKFELFDSSNNSVGIKKSNENGKLVFEKLPIGEYYFKEVKPPEGYQLSNEIYKFEVSKNNEVISREITNTREKTTLTKTGRNNAGYFIGLILILLVISKILSNQFNIKNHM